MPINSMHQDSRPGHSLPLFYCVWVRSWEDLETEDNLKVMPRITQSSFAPLPGAHNPFVCCGELIHSTTASEQLIFFLPQGAHYSRWKPCLRSPALSLGHSTSPAHHKPTSITGIGKGITVTCRGALGRTGGLLKMHSGTVTYFTVMATGKISQTHYVCV